VFGWIMLAAAVLAGLASLVGICLLTPTGRMLLVVFGAALVVFAVSIVSALAGRVTAGIFNFARLQFGRADLEASMRRSRRDRLVMR
jgi:hypothetical protein